MYVLCTVWYAPSRRAALWSCVPSSKIGSWPQVPHRPLCVRRAPGSGAQELERVREARGEGGMKGVSYCSLCMPAAGHQQLLSVVDESGRLEEERAGCCGGGQQRVQ